MEPRLCVSVIYEQLKCSLSLNEKSQKYTVFLRKGMGFGQLPATLGASNPELTSPQVCLLYSFESSFIQNNKNFDASATLNPGASEVDTFLGKHLQDGHLFIFYHFTLANAWRFHSSTVNPSKRTSLSLTQMFTNLKYTQVK